MLRSYLRKTIIVVLILIVILCIVMVGCEILYQDPVIQSLPSYESEAFYSSGGFQDFTDYGIYDYSNMNLEKLQDNQYFEPVDAQLSDVLSYIENFEGCIEVHRNSEPDNELSTNYHFDKTVIDEQDYFYLETKEGTPIGNTTYRKFDNYTLYLFDVQTKTLYYFHSNI